MAKGQGWSAAIKERRWRINLHSKYRGDIMTKNPLTPNFASSPLKLPRPGCFPSCWHVSGLTVVLERKFSPSRISLRSHSPTVVQHSTNTRAARNPSSTRTELSETTNKLGKPFQCQTRLEKSFEKRNHSLQLRPSRANSASFACQVRSPGHLLCEGGTGEPALGFAAARRPRLRPLFRWLAWRHPIRGVRSRHSKI